MLNLKKSVRISLYFLLNIIIISAPALYNGYPIMYYDSGNYIHYSISLDDVSTNPIGYCLFIRAFSWQFTLWPVVFAQGLIISLLIFFVVKTFVKPSYLFSTHFFIITFLTLFTGLGWISSHIMADIFASIAVLAVFLIINEKSTIQVKIFAGIVLFIAGTTHFSIGLITVLLLILYFIVVAMLKISRIRQLAKSILWPFVIIVLSGLFINNYHLINSNTEKAKSIRHVLLMARLMETGILDEFLKKNCDECRYTLCYYRDQFPYTPSQFVWEKESPFFKTGGWSYSEEEYNEIISRIFTNPRYISLFAYKSVISTLKQLCLFNVKILHLNSDYPGPIEPINNNFKHEEKKFSTSSQHYRDACDLTILNTSYYISVGISLFIIVFFLGSLFWKSDRSLLLLIILLLLGVLCNAFVNGTFSNVIPRYQARINWLLVLGALLIVFSKARTFWLLYASEGMNNKTSKKHL